MALTPRLDLRQTQSLVMTPQLQQAIKLLQLSNLELSAYVEQQLEQNPLLERDDFDAHAPEARGPDEAVVAGAEPASGVDHAVADESGQVSANAMDTDYDNLFDSDGPSGGGGDLTMADGSWGLRGGSDEGMGNIHDTTPSRSRSLRDHLTEQLSIDISDPVDRIIGLQLIEMLDDAGYLALDPAEIAEVLGCDTRRVQMVLARVQQFDPPGIFARNLAECLWLQLRERDRLDEPMKLLLENLDLLAKAQFPELAEVCGVGMDALESMIHEIRSLNPKPASPFDDMIMQPVTPDVLMRPKPGGWMIELNSETLPRVLVNNHYYNMVSNASRKREDKQYITECFQAANWLVRSLHQRATTILKVSSEIVRQQEGFFKNGVQSLRPLVLRDIAQAVDLHESTVSRVTSNKYIATPRGIYELKYFFGQAIGSSTGGVAHSAEWVRHRIKALIEAEAADRVLSDDNLVEVLQREGIDIARRTVAKYREGMAIPSSVHRRRQKCSRPSREARAGA